MDKKIWTESYQLMGAAMIGAMASRWVDRALSAPTSTLRFVSFLFVGVAVLTSSYILLRLYTRLKEKTSQ